MKNEATHIFTDAMNFVGLIFAVLNVRTWWVGRKSDKNKDYAELLRENAKLKRRNEELQKLIL